MKQDRNDRLWPACSQADPPPPKKNACPDCSFCQLCSDARCNCCRSAKTAGSCSKMSLSEQIRLYDEINANDPLLTKKCK